MFYIVDIDFSNKISNFYQFRALRDGTYFRDGRLFEGDYLINNSVIRVSAYIRGVAYSSHHGMSLFAW